jgi:hypothetical protein
VLLSHTLLLLRASHLNTGPPVKAGERAVPDARDHVFMSTAWSRTMVRSMMEREWMRGNGALITRNFTPGGLSFVLY